MASMGKKAIQKQAVAYSMETGEEMARMDVSGFRLYVHYKYMWAGDLTGEDIDKHRMLFRVEDNPETKTLEEIFYWVAKNSQKHVLTEEEVAVAVAVASYYTAEGVNLNPKHTLQEAGVKSEDRIDIVVNAMDNMVKQMDEMAMETPQAKFVQDGTHSMMPPHVCVGTFFFQ